MFINCLDPEKESRRRHFLWLMTIVKQIGVALGGGRRPWHEENPVASGDFILFLYGQKI